MMISKNYNKNLKSFNKKYKLFDKKIKSLIAEIPTCPN
jgi:hypothetical protein